MTVVLFKKKQNNDSLVLFAVVTLPSFSFSFFFLSIAGLFPFVSCVLFPPPPSPLPISNISCRTKFPQGNPSWTNILYNNSSGWWWIYWSQENDPQEAAEGTGAVTSLRESSEAKCMAWVAQRNYFPMTSSRKSSEAKCMAWVAQHNYFPWPAQGRAARQSVWLELPNRIISRD